MDYTDRERYKGNWYEGRYHGKGELKKLNGEKKAGLWKKGKYLVFYDKDRDKGECVIV